jgi:enolase
MSLFMALNSDAVIAGDYYTISNPLRIQTALEKKTINAIVIKPSFIGTVTESLAVASIAKLAGLKTIISDRTGETNETFLADFAVGVQADYIRFGAPVRGERVAKYNRMLQIANDLQVKK